MTICTELVSHFSTMLELNNETFKAKDDWYYRYASVLIGEITDLKPVLKLIKESKELQATYSMMPQELHLYACILGIIRFLEVTIL